MRGGDYRDPMQTQAGDSTTLLCRFLLPARTIFPPTQGDGLRFFLVNFQDAHHADVGILERLLDVRELGILNLQNEIRFRCHDRAS